MNIAEVFQNKTRQNFIEQGMNRIHLSNLTSLEGMLTDIGKTWDEPYLSIKYYNIGKARDEPYSSIKYYNIGKARDEPYSSIEHFKYQGLYDP